VRERHRHSRESFRGRVHDHHRVAFPRLARPLVSDTSPQVDDLLAVHVRAAGAAELVAPIEVLDERLAHSLVSIARPAAANR
jgi:hypothetical protein